MHYGLIVLDLHQWRIQGERGGAAAPIDLTNFCINVNSNPRMHEKTHHFQVKIQFFSGEGAHPPRPLPSTVRPHYKVLDPLLARTVLIAYCLDVNMYVPLYAKN